MIDRVIALTIDKRIYRCWAFLGYNLARGVPLEKICFWRGQTPLAFSNEYEKIADAAEADGFPFIRKFQGYNNLKVIKQHPAQMCQVWSYAEMLRYVVKSQETCLLLWDDRFLATPFSLINVIAEQMQASEEDFYLFQLRIRGGPKEIRDKRVWTAPEDSESIEVYQEMFDAFTASSDVHIDYKKAFTRPGLLGYDESIVWTPKGAQWMLDCLHALEDVPSDIKQHSYFELSDAHLPEFAPCINIDNYICWGLRPHADLEIESGKGLYCPRNIGFNFIDEPLALGSDTNFLTEYVHERYQFYKNETDLQFLN